MRLHIAALMAVVMSACSTPSPSTPAASDPGPAKRPARDYEAMARKLYEKETGYEEKWPVEFHIRINEGLTQDLNRAIKDLGGNIGPDLFATKTELGWAAPEPEEPLLAGVRVAHWKETPP